ncbi:carbohydrate ABC transporter permease [Martelella endophytica]|uniref:carbohydrate ABC transporter permease n=1 Tax=Martelella endophytica TaxID=1486262 RepID=UPI000AB8CB33|nr:sugar ABC transporter permease [Martelella endophytica]
MSISGKMQQEAVTPAAKAEMKPGGGNPPPGTTVRSSRRSRLAKQMFPYLLLLPTVGLLVTFCIYPLAQGLFMSLFRRGIVVTERVPATWPKFVGFDNFVAVFEDPEFLGVLARTVGFVVFAVPLVTIVSLLLALLLKKTFFGSGAVRAVVFFPAMISLLITGVVWKWLFGFNSGLINYVLSLVSIEPVPWLQDASMAQIAVVLVWVWANAGFYMMIIITGLTTIPEELYEAARIDAASPWRAFWRITLPLLKPTLSLVMILASVEAFKVYELVVSLTGGGPGRSTVYLIQTIYETAFRKPNAAGIAAAQSAILFVALLLLTIVQLRMSREKT